MRSTRPFCSFKRKRRVELQDHPILQMESRSSLSRTPIDTAFCQRRQFLVGGFLFLEILLQELRAVIASELLGPGDQAAVAGDFVMFDSLRSSNQSSVKHGAVIDLTCDVISLLNDPVDGGTVDTRWLVPMQAEDLLKTPNLVPGFRQMRLKSLLQLWVIGFFNHVRKRTQNLSLGVIDVAQGVHK